MASKTLPQSHNNNNTQQQQQQQGSRSLIPQNKAAIVATQQQYDTNSADGNSSGPAYTRPIIANLLPEYTNAHAEAIRQAFLPTSFRTISSLHSVDPSVEGKPAFHVPKTNATFSDFEYSCSPYEAEQEFNAQSRKESLAKQRKIAGDQEILAFRTAFPAKKDKYDPLWDTPFLSEPYNEADQAALTREKMLKAATEKPFVPPGVQKSIGKPTRALLNDAMASLFRCLAEDWPDAQPTVLTTAEDLIVIYFPLERIRNPDGVTTYMSHALRRNEVVLEFDLRRVVEGWNVKTDDGFLLFTLRPPWVKARNFIKAAQQEEQAQAALMASFNNSSSHQK
jgi:hypothetical protein